MNCRIFGWNIASHFEHLGFLESVTTYCPVILGELLKKDDLKMTFEGDFPIENEDI